MNREERLARKRARYAVYWIENRERILANKRRVAAMARAPDSLVALAEAAKVQEDAAIFARLELERIDRKRAVHATNQRKYLAKIRAERDAQFQACYPIKPIRVRVAPAESPPVLIPSHDAPAEVDRVAKWHEEAVRYARLQTDLNEISRARNGARSREAWFAKKLTRDDDHI